MRRGNVYVSRSFELSKRSDQTGELRVGCCEREAFWGHLLRVASANLVMKGFRRNIGSDVSISGKALDVQIAKVERDVERTVSHVRLAYFDRRQNQSLRLLRSCYTREGIRQGDVARKRAGCIDGI